MKLEEEQLLEEVVKGIAEEKSHVKTLLKEALENEAHHDNPFIILSVAKDLYAHAKAIMDLKMSAPAWADI